jgi:quinol monooxygenase YgiN
MSGEIMTEVSAEVAEDRAGEVRAAFAELTRRPLPDGLMRTELLSGRDGEWRIQSVWRDQAALDAMRAGPEPPAAPALFRHLGAEPVLRIYAVAARHAASAQDAG